eukprot:260043-Pelagomonas_calceolata.AAC.1
MHSAAAHRSSSSRDACGRLRFLRGRKPWPCLSRACQGARLTTHAVPQGLCGCSQAMTKPSIARGNTRLRPTTFGLRLTNPGLRLTNPGLRLTNPGLRLTNPGLRLTKLKPTRGFGSSNSGLRLSKLMPSGSLGSAVLQTFFSF